VIEAARDKDIVVVTIPEKNIPDLLDDLFAGAGDVVVVRHRQLLPPAARWSHRRD
jgi:predicted dinucleotide-binding enzyme